MYGKREWKGVPGSVISEMEVDEITKEPFCLDEKELPQSFIHWFKENKLGYGELIIEFESSGYYIPMSMYGGSDHLGWPEEGDEERVIVSIYFLINNVKNFVPKELWNDLEDAFSKEIEGADLDEADCDGEPDYEPDYDDVDVDESLIDRAEDNYQNWRE